MTEMRTCPSPIVTQRIPTIRADRSVSRAPQPGIDLQILPESAKLDAESATGTPGHRLA